MMRIVNGATNANPIIIHSPMHGFTDERINIFGVTGNLAANGADLDYEVIDADHIALLGTTGSGEYTGGGLIDTGYTDTITQQYVYPSNINGSTSDNDGRVVIIKFSHGLTTGDRVGIAGHATPEVNGNWTVTVLDVYRLALDGTSGYTAGQNLATGPIGMLWQRP